MRMATRDELLGDDYRRGSSRKPPRGPHARRRRCASEDVRRESERLTTFQKLDREMGVFVKAQKGRSPPGGGGREMPVSEEDSCSVRGVRHGVKWRCGWMFEQDSLYWETVRRQDVSGGEEKDSWRRGKSRAKGLRGDIPSCDSSSGDIRALRHHCSTDHESVSSGMELHLRRRRSHALRRPTREAKRQTPHHEANAGEENEKGWPAVLKAKCEVLQMEKELADQKLRQQCAEMAQAAEMAHCLRASVQTILETAKRGTVSAPSTPGRLHGPENNNPGGCIQERIQRLQTVNVQRDLEEQAKSFQNRIDNLRLKSQVRSEDSSFRSKDLLSKTRLSSTSTTTQVLTSDGEDWAQVQEVLKQLRGKTGSLQFSCENWEKRAIFAESKAASLQIEEEKWRLEVQKSEEKVRVLERELMQVKATLEDVRNRHALEQSRLLGSGSNHGYTLVLQPIVTSHGNSTGCRCTTSSECETCGGHHHGSGNHQARSAVVAGGDSTPLEVVPKEATFGNDEIDATTVDEPQARSDPAASDPGNEVMTPSPDRESPSESTTSGQGSSTRHKIYEGEASPTPTVAGSEVNENVKTEVEKSLSQKWFKQRPKSRRPGCESITVSETRNSNLGNSPIPAKLQGGGGAAGRGFAGHNGVMIRKPAGPVYAGNGRLVSSPSHLEKRMPLRELKRNSVPNDATRTECS